jgi:hypothetical protein
MLSAAAAFSLSMVANSGLVANAAEILCDDATHPIAQGSTVTGTLTVPPGATCTLDNVTVHGNVLVDPTGCLIAGESAGGATIDGDISATKAACLAIGFGSTVDGSVTALATTGVPPNPPAESNNYICNTKITGNLSIASSGPNAKWCIGSTSSSPCQCGAPNTIEHNMTFDSNLGGGVIADNTIVGSLICEGNNPAPTGSGNLAANFEKPTLGQCSALVVNVPKLSSTNSE